MLEKIGLWFCHVCKRLSAGVTVGLQQSDITVSESSWFRSAEVCVVIKCGCIRRNIGVTLDVQDGTALGMQLDTTYVNLINVDLLLNNSQAFTL